MVRAVRMEIADAPAWIDGAQVGGSGREVRAVEEVAAPAACSLVVVGYVCLAVGAGWSNGALHPMGLALALAAFALGVAAAWWAREPGVPRPAGSLYLALAVLPTVSMLMWPAPYESTAPAFNLATRLFGLVAVALLGVHAAGDERWRRRAFGALLVGGLGVLVLAPLAVPRPIIDGWQLFQYGSRNLLHGANPYTTPVPDIYEGRFDYGYKVEVFDYPPLNLLLAAPGVALLGDYRYVLAGALVGATLLLRATGRRLGVPARLLDVLVLAFVLHPRAVYVTAVGWAEPMLVLALAAFVYCEVRWPRGTAQAIAFCALPALKQYFAIPWLLYVTTRPKLRSLLVGMAVAAATAVPFLLWDFRATMEYGLLFVVRRVPFRPDALSIPALLYHFTQVPCTKLPAVIAQVAVGGAALAWLRRRGLAGLLLAVGLALLASFLVGSQAFLNYYFLVGAVLLFAAVALAGTRGAPAAAEGATR